jgi:hypothetical protein
MKIVSRLAAVSIAVGAIISLSGCSDDTPPSKSPLLVDKTWEVSSYTINGSDAMEDCIADNTLLFFGDGTYQDNVGALTCEEDEEDTEGVWKFKANETIISLKPNGDLESDWNILELTGNTFTFSQYIDVLDSEVIVTMTVN